MKNITFLLLLFFSVLTVNAQSIDMLKGMNVDNLSESQLGDLIYKNGRKRSLNEPN